MRVLTRLESVSSTEVLLRKRFRKRMIISDEDERTILKASAGKCIMNRHYAAIAYPFPRLNRSDGLFIG